MKIASPTNKLLTKARDKDPAMAIVLRTAFTNDALKRLRELKQVVYKSIVTNDCFGLRKEKISIFVEETNPKQFQYLSDDKKVEAFNSWLATQINKGVLEVKQDGPWTNYYIKKGYDKGQFLGSKDLYKYTGDVLFQRARRIADRPVDIERVQMLYTRAFDQLKDITTSMSTQIGRILAEGFLQGKTANQIAKEINEKIDKIGLTRAKKFARTELQYVVNFAIIKEYERGEELLGEEVKGRWWTQQDERVRARHKAWHGKVFTRKQLMGMIGEVNCRCSVLPYIKSMEK